MTEKKKECIFLIGVHGSGKTRLFQDMRSKIGIDPEWVTVPEYPLLIPMSKQQISKETAFHLQLQVLQWYQQAVLFCRSCNLIFDQGPLSTLAYADYHKITGPVPFDGFPKYINLLHERISRTHSIKYLCLIPSLEIIMSQLTIRCREEGRSKDETSLPYVKGIQERLTEEWMDKQGVDSSLYTFLTYKPKEVDYICNHQTLIKWFGFGGD